MFPLRWNFPFRKKDGSITTIDDAISSGGGGGGGYTLPTASANVKGGVKIGEGLTMDGEVLKNTNPTPATPYELPTASSEVLGGIKVGNGLSIEEDGTVSTSGGGGAGGSIVVSSKSVSSQYNANSTTLVELTPPQSGDILIGVMLSSANWSQYTEPSNTPEIYAMVGGVTGSSPKVCIVNRNSSAVSVGTIYAVWYRA